MAGFCKGNIAQAGCKVASKWRVARNVAQELFPADAVRIAIGSKRRGFTPVVTLFIALPEPKVSIEPG